MKVAIDLKQILTDAGTLPKNDPLWPQCELALASLIDKHFSAAQLASAKRLAAALGESVKAMEAHQVGHFRFQTSRAIQLSEAELRTYNEGKDV